MKVSPRASSGVRGPFPVMAINVAAGAALSFWAVRDTFKQK